MHPILKDKRLYLALLIAFGGWKTYQWFAGDAPKVPANVARVTAVESVRKDVPIQLSLVGTVVAYETVAVKSRIDSQVVEVHFKDGDNVKEGQVLFELDDRTLLAQQKEYEAALQKEKAQLANAKLQYDRSVQLFKSKTVAQSRVDDTKAAYAAQLAQVGATQASLDSTSVQLSYTKITAPISGRAGTINVTRGNNVKANDTSALVTINQVSPIRVHFAISQRYYDQVKTAMIAGNMPVSAVRAESTDSATGTLEYVDNAIDTSNGTFAARAIFANEDEKLWPGMFVSVTMNLGKITEALTVPAVAIQGDEGSRFVFTVDAEGKKAIKKPVDVSQIVGDTAIVTSGIALGEKVIVDGILRVTDGGAIDTSPLEKKASTDAEAEKKP